MRDGVQTVSPVRFDEDLRLRIATTLGVQEGMPNAKRCRRVCYRCLPGYHGRSSTRHKRQADLDTLAPRVSDQCLQARFLFWWCSCKINALPTTCTL